MAELNPTNDASMFVVGKDGQTYASADIAKQYGQYVAPATTVATTTPKTISPAVLSSADARDTTNKNIQKLNEIQSSVDQSYADTKTKLSGQETAIDDELTQYNTMLDSRINKIDANAELLINSIKQMYVQRKSEMEQLNKATMGGLTTSGIRSGRQRYANEIQTSILSGEERAGIQRMSELDREEAMLVMEARNAAEEKSFALLDKKMTLMSEARKEKTALIRDLHNMAMEQEKLAMTRASEVREEKKFYTDLQTAAKDFALTWKIDQPFYVVGGVGFDSSTGEALPYDEYIARGGKPDFSNAKVVDANSLEARSYVMDLASKYIDAGINFDDTPEVAMAKAKKSAVFRKDTYIAPVGGIGGAQTKQQQDLIANARTALDQQKAGSTDTYANPDTYRDYLSKYIAAGGNASDFYAALDRESYISEGNRKGNLSLSSNEISNVKLEEKDVQPILDKYGISSITDYQEKAASMSVDDYFKLSKYFGG